MVSRPPYSPLIGGRVSQYGVHIFHTKYPRVEEYVKRYSGWVPYQHRVVGRVRDQNDTGNLGLQWSRVDCSSVLTIVLIIYLYPERIVPIPPNIDTVNILFNAGLDTEEDMVRWLDQRRPQGGAAPSNGEEMSISRVGADLYEKIFKPYTR